MPSVVGFETMNEPHPGWLGPELRSSSKSRKPLAIFLRLAAWPDRKERLHQGPVRGSFSRTGGGTHASACQTKR